MTCRCRRRRSGGAAGAFSLEFRALAERGGRCASARQEVALRWGRARLAGVAGVRVPGEALLAVEAEALLARVDDNLVVHGLRREPLRCGGGKRAQVRRRVRPVLRPWRGDVDGSVGASQSGGSPAGRRGRTVRVHGDGGHGLHGGIGDVFDLHWDAVLPHSERLRGWGRGEKRGRTQRCRAVASDACEAATLCVGAGRREATGPRLVVGGGGEAAPLVHESHRVHSLQSGAPRRSGKADSLLKQRRGASPPVPLSTHAIWVHTRVPPKWVDPGARRVRAPRGARRTSA